MVFLDVKESRPGSEQKEHQTRKHVVPLIYVSHKECACQALISVVPGLEPAGIDLLVVCF